MDLIKLANLHAILLDEKITENFLKNGIWNEINEIGKRCNIDEFDSNLVNHVILKPKVFIETSRRHTHFMRSKYAPICWTTNFSFEFMPKNKSSKEFDLTPISQMDYILNIDKAYNEEEMFEHQTEAWTPL